MAKELQAEGEYQVASNVSLRLWILRAPPSTVTSMGSSNTSVLPLAKVTVRLKGNSKVSLMGGVCHEGRPKGTVKADPLDYSGWPGSCETSSWGTRTTGQNTATPLRKTSMK